MATPSRPISGLWSDDSPRTSRVNSYMSDTPNERDIGLPDNALDDRSPLDRTIDKIGMGTYQWTLLSLCGFGWMADNMWIQAIAIILPRVQQHYTISDNMIGTLSSTMFAGMMVGAIGWGTCSDLLGRSMAFNATLFFTALFGLLSSITTSFTTLCVTLFFLGSAVGGSMPTDGTLLLEQLPNDKRYLVTALSVFFSLGSVFSAVAAILVVPRYSCFSSDEGGCDANKDNLGWKYLLIVLGLLTLVMTILRVLFFRLYESPRFLVAAGRPKEAMESLQLISKFNGEELSLSLRDVRDHFGTVTHRRSHSADIDNDEDADSTPFLRQEQEPQEMPKTIFDAETETTRISTTPPDSFDYSSTGESNNSLESHSFATPVIEHQETPFAIPSPEEDEYKRPVRRPIMPRRNRSSVYRASTVLPTVIRRPLWVWLDRVALVLSPEWLWTTLMMWATWFSMSLAYTMFNVYLPKLLETRLGGMTPDDVNSPRASPSSSLVDSLWDVVIYSIGGCPGAILGAYLVESSLGRRWSLAGSTFITAFFCMVFVRVDGPLALKASTVGISLSATTMWAILYGWTPEIFGTNVRGTACGIASALSRIGGMIAPMLGGRLLTIDVSFPVYVSIVTFAVAGICVLLIKEREKSGDDDGKKAMVH